MEMLAEHSLQGLRLKTADDPTRAHREFEDWVDEVADWLSDLAPSSGLSAEWSALRHVRMVTKPGYYDSDKAWVMFRYAVGKRLEWLGKLGQRVRFAEDGQKEVAQAKAPVPSDKVFVVHGRDEGARESVARFLERLGLTPVILHEQPNRGRTIIEKFVDHSDVGFAVVLLTGDDVGRLADKMPDADKPRARQNVILELGFFLGRLGRERVCPLYRPGVELPSDYDGVVFVELDRNGAWKMLLARELKAAGLPVDMNRTV